MTHQTSLRNTSEQKPEQPLSAERLSRATFCRTPITALRAGRRDGAGNIWRLSSAPRDVATPRLTRTPTRFDQPCRYENVHVTRSATSRLYEASFVCLQIRLVPSLLPPHPPPTPNVSGSTVASTPRILHDHNLVVLQPHNLADSTTTTSRHPAALAAYLVSRAYALFYLPLTCYLYARKK